MVFKQRVSTVSVNVFQILKSWLICLGGGRGGEGKGEPEEGAFLSSQTYKEGLQSNLH